MIDFPSPNFDRRPDGVPIDILVLHYTGMPSAQAALARLTDDKADVSAHYLIDEDGTSYALVDESHRAWHAGLSAWRGQTNINARSIGIELVNPGHEFGYRPFPQPQMVALTSLAKEILTRHPIPSRNVVGHSDIAPRRKEDPGELFDWKELAANGIGLWPELQGPIDNSLVKADWPRRLGLLGYDVSDRDGDAAGMAGQAALAAFQRHFRPTRIDGIADFETIALLNALLWIMDMERR
jgi:N-acetylmuramoyl-L-alanine amidase